MINHKPFVLLCGLEGSRTQRQWTRAGIQCLPDLDRILETLHLADRKEMRECWKLIVSSILGQGIVLNGVVWCRLMIMKFLKSDSFM